MNNSSSVDKIWFIFSLLVLSLLYGTAVGKWKWFPHSILDRAVDQARAVRVFQSDSHVGIPLLEKVHEGEGVQVPKPEKKTAGNDGHHVFLEGGRRLEGRTQIIRSRRRDFAQVAR